MDRKRLLSPMKQQSFVLLHCRVGHTVRLKRADAVQTGAAFAARPVAALIAAPCQLILPDCGCKGSDFYLICKRFVEKSSNYFSFLLLVS